MASAVVAEIQMPPPHLAPGGNSAPGYQLMPSIVGSPGRTVRVT